MNSELTSFVKNMTDGRDESHDYNHMLRVKRFACELASEEFTDLTDIIVVAMLHDIADSKYDIIGTQRILLKEFIPNRRKIF